MDMDRASKTDICKRTIAAVEEADMVIVAPHEEAMNNQVPKYVTQARASFLLGIPEAEFRRMAKESGLGHVERAGNEEETYFTYEELQRICKLAAHQMQAVH
jgi:hypothetical protein